MTSYRRNWIAIFLLICFTGVKCQAYGGLEECNKITNNFYVARDGSVSNSQSGEHSEVTRIAGPPGKRGPKGESGIRGRKGSVGPVGRIGHPGVTQKVVQNLTERISQIEAINHLFSMNLEKVNSILEKLSPIVNDVDECANESLHTCSTDSGMCVNTIGSYYCLCKPGWSKVPGPKNCLPKNCNSLSPISKNGKYHILPVVGNEPFEVYCDFTSEPGKGITMVGHNTERKTLASGCYPAGCFSRSITYEIDMTQIENLISVSSTCKQFIRYECSDSTLNRGSVAWGWWVSRHGRKMTNWGGTTQPNSCSCVESGTCPNSKKCNCDKNDATIRFDEGYLTDKEDLPVTELKFGDLNNERPEYYNLGKLQCV